MLRFFLSGLSKFHKNTRLSQLLSLPDNKKIIKALSLMSVACLFLFLINNYLTYWRGWPEFGQFLTAIRGTSDTSLQPGQEMKGWLTYSGYAIVLFYLFFHSVKSPLINLRDVADQLSTLTAFIIRAAFWSVFLIGLVDMIISLLRVEGVLENIVGKHLNTQLGRSIFRGTYVHYPLILVSIIIAFFTRSIGFIWLAFLVVVAELQIVISRFVFSYEQAFMGDLVRFWYAALFLFSSAYTLLHEGHVRVDVMYVTFSKKAKSWSNIIGSLLLGLPLCWVILVEGMASKSSSINSPILSFEISQSGYGMYIKYLMAGFLVVFAVTMAIQFVSLILSNAANLFDEPDNSPLNDELTSQ